jgi:peptidoglycan/LPS O-acetylase OafA/YrhL
MGGSAGNIVVRLGRWLRLTSGAQQEIAALDGLRALAVLLVVWHHVYRWGAGDWSVLRLPVLSATFDFGFIGVLLFFVLSGFLLFLPYARALVAPRPWPSARQFYRRRALRILPVYFAALSILGILLAEAGKLQGWILKGLVLDFLLLQNLSPAAAKLVGNVDGPLWTLAIEWQFYLLLPWMARGIARLCGRGARPRRTVTRTAIALGGLIAFGLGLRTLSALTSYGSPAQTPLLGQTWFRLGLRALSGRYLEDFALGMLLSLLYALALERGWLTRRWIARIGGIAAATAVPGLVLCYLWAQRLDVFGAENDWTFIPGSGWSWIAIGIWTTTLCFALLVGGVLAGPGLLRRIFSLAPLRWIGITSYSMYVWHLPVINLVRSTGMALATILLLTLASYYIIERPFLRCRYSTRPSAPVPAPAAAAIAATSVS